MKRLCRLCGKRQAKFIYRMKRRLGKPLVIVGADKHHDLCLQCYRSVRTKIRHFNLEVRD